MRKSFKKTISPHAQYMTLTNENVFSIGMELDAREKLLLKHSMIFVALELLSMRP